LNENCCRQITLGLDSLTLDPASGGLGGYRRDRREFNAEPT
jgi:hypothetical protein